MPYQVQQIDRGAIHTPGVGPVFAMVQAGPVKDALTGFLASYLMATREVHPGSETIQAEPIGVTATLAHLRERNAPSGEGITNATY